MSGGKNLLRRDIEKSQGAGMFQERKYGTQNTGGSQYETPQNDEWDIIKKVQDKLNNKFRESILTERNNPDFINELRMASEKFLNEEGNIQADIMKKTRLVQAILDEILGFGPLEGPLSKSEITEIIVNTSSKVYVEKKGKLQLDPDIYFNDEQHLRNTIDKIVQPIGRRIDESSPIVDARLPDGSRVNAIIPPVSPKGSLLTIRKFPEYRLTPQDYLNFGSIDEKMLIFLKACVEAKVNIVVSGGTGTGKTTLLNLVSGFIPGHESIITIEDSCELKLNQDNWRQLEARPPNNEGKGAITIRDLVKASLRMRPDRVVVGECRGGEALDMLQAMNTGHDGSLTTGHANSPKDMLSRLEVMVLMAGMDLPVRAIREQIASAVDLIVQIGRLRDGTRKITNITHVLGIGKDGFTRYKKFLKKIDTEDTAEDEDIDTKEMEPDKIYLQDIFYYKQTGLEQHGKIKGDFLSTGYIPRSIMKKIEMSSIQLPPDIFRVG